MPFAKLHYIYTVHLKRKASLSLVSGLDTRSAKFGVKSRTGMCPDEPGH